MTDGLDKYTEITEHRTKIRGGENERVREMIRKRQTDRQTEKLGRDSESD